MKMTSNRQVGTARPAKKSKRFNTRRYRNRLRWNEILRPVDRTKQISTLLH